MTRLSFHRRNMVVADEVMESTLQLATAAGRTLAPVLLCGESGTGKELVARFIHEKSARAKGPFISVNCAAIPESLMEAELFGFERGAFTGALSQRIGKFEQATHGTLLLDEISEMPVALQAKLLRVLQEREIDRLGGRSPVAIDTRVIATTNRDLHQMIREERFREDLFYRLNVIRIDCLPLRGRRQAVLSLVNEFIADSAQNQGREAVPRLSAAAAEKLATYAWPGNIRELQNAVEKAVLMAEGETVDARHFDFLRGRQAAPAELKLETLATLEHKHILKVLDQTAGHRNQAAHILGISVRTLRNKLKLYGVA